MTNLKFRISTGLKDIIGKELINNDDIAIFELVKNSYDAKANHVKIIFQDILGPVSKAKIFIVDDGNGMSFEDIKEKWLSVGFSDKKFQVPKEVINKKGITSKNRAFAGAKGIGRFSADRLGRFMSMYTRQQRTQKLNKIELDWKDFEHNQEKNFDSVNVNHSIISQVPTDVSKHGNFDKGTIVEISNLNTKWDEKKLLNLKRYLQRLINPTIERNIHDFKIEIISPDFFKIDTKRENVDKINGFIKNIVFEKFEKQTTRVSCKIVDGKIFTRVVDKGSLVFDLEEDNLYSKLDNVYIHIFYLTPTARTSFTKIMGITHREYGSIFLYKNGFRIHPYGEESDDWLELEKRKGQGYARFLANREIIGRAEIYGEQSGFKETSSRDGGIIKSQALDDLKIFIVKKALIRLEKYVVEGISWDPEEEDKKKSPQKIASDSLKVIAKLIGKKNPDMKITIGKDLIKLISKRQTESLPEIIKNIEFLKKFVKTKNEKEYLSNQVRALRSATKSISKAQKKVQEELEIRTKETYFLRKAVSSDSKIILNLNHTIKLTSKKIEGLIHKIVKRIKGGGKIESILPFLDQISIANQKIKSLSKIASIANFNVRATTLEDEDLVKYIKEYTRIMIESATEGIDLEFSNEKLEHYTNFIPLSISTMLDNLIDNSDNAEANKIFVRFERRKNLLCMYFADNGKGIRKKDEPYLFTRGHTTTAGSGLGLHHIRTIAEEHGGSANFKGNNFRNFGRGAVFEVIFHKSN